MFKFTIATDSLGFFQPFKKFFLRSAIFLDCHMIIQMLACYVCHNRDRKIGPPYAILVERVRSHFDNRVFAAWLLRPLANAFAAANSKAS